MKRTTKNIFWLALVCYAFIGSGCFTPSVLKESKARVAIRKSIQSNNESAMRALRSGLSPQEAGIHVSTWEAIKERPAALGGAVVGDGMLVWGGVEGIQWLADQGGDNNGGTEQDAGRDNTSVTVNGDGNTVLVRGDENTTGGSGEAL